MPLVVLAMLVGNLVYGQATARYALAYTETQKTMFLVANPQVAGQLNAVDKVGFAPSERVQNVAILQDANNDLTRTITVVSDGEKKSWMPAVKTIILDKNGMRTLKPDNSIAIQTPADENYTLEYNTLKSDFISKGVTSLFPIRVPNAAEIAQMQADGLTVTTRNNITKISGPGILTLIDLGQNSIANTYSDQGNVFLEQKISFVTSASGLRPSKKIEKYHETTGDGLCYVKQVVTTYSNYQEQVPR